MLPILPLHRKYEYHIFPNKHPVHLRMRKGGWGGGHLLWMGKFHVDSAKHLAFFLKYGGVVTT